MSYSLSSKERAIVWRKQGASLSVIAKHFHASKSTISLWVRPVALSLRLKRELIRKSKKGARKGLMVLRMRRLVRRQQLQKESQYDVMYVVRKADTSWYRVVAALLFWCEGNKRSLSDLRITNSDPALIRSFLYALRKAFPLQEERWKAVLHLHGYHDEATQKKFWSKVTSIPESQFRATYWKPHSGTRKRDGYPGCISLRYGNAELAKRLDMIYHIFAQSLGVW